MQQAQARGIDSAQLLLAVSLGYLVFAITEEGEVVIGNPAQELAGFMHRRRIQRQIALWQVVSDSQRHIAHGGPVANHRTHIVQRRLDVRFELRLRGFVGHAVDLEMHHRLGPARWRRVRFVAQLQQLARRVALHRDHRMDDRVDLHCVGEHHAGGVDQKRHVVGNDLEQAAASRALLRVHHTHYGVTGRALLRKGQQAGDELGPLCRRVQFDIAAGKSGEKGLTENLGLREAFRRQAGVFQFLKNHGR